MYHSILAESSLSPEETLGLVSSFNSKHYERVNCHSCLYRPKKTEETIYRDRAAKGCFEPKKDPIFQTIVSGITIKYFDCIGNHTTSAFPYLFSWYENAKNHGYDVWKTPSKLVDVYNLLDNLMSDYLKEMQEQNRQAKGGR